MFEQAQLRTISVLVRNYRVVVNRATRTRDRSLT